MDTSDWTLALPPCRGQLPDRCPGGGKREERGVWGIRAVCALLGDAGPENGRTTLACARRVQVGVHHPSATLYLKGNGAARF